VRSLLPAEKNPEKVYTPVPAASHLIAINAVQSGAADYAVVKTCLGSAKFPGLALVGEDQGENSEQHADHVERRRRRLRRGDQEPPCSNSRRTTAPSQRGS